MKEETTTKAPKEHIPRRIRRVQESKTAVLNKLVSEFFLKRSTVKDPEGEICAEYFDTYKALWIKEYKNFNKSKSRPFTLRQKAFDEQVEYFIQMEKKQQEKMKTEKETKDFNHWYRRAHVWKTRPLTAIKFLVKSLGNHHKMQHMWKNYYINNVLAND